MQRTFECEFEGMISSIITSIDILIFILGEDELWNFNSQFDQ